MRDMASCQLLALARPVPMASAASAGPNVAPAGPMLPNPTTEPNLAPAGSMSPTAKPIIASHPGVSSAEKEELREGIDHLLLRFKRQRHISRDLGTIKGAASISQKVLGANAKDKVGGRVTLFIVQGIHLPEYRDIVTRIMRLLKDTFNQSCWPKISSLESQEGLIACGVRNECRGKILGSIILKRPDKSEVSTPMLIPWLCVREGYRSCGIGHLLMQMARQIQIHQLGRIDIFLIADHESEEALRFYQREGFAIIKWNDNEKIDELGRENDYMHDHNIPMHLLIE